MTRVYLSPPDVGPSEKWRLLGALDSNWIAPLGPDVDAFEDEVARTGGMVHGAALSSGTAALHLALRILDVGPGDEVLVSSLTFAATANPITYVGAQPVFIDADEATWQMDPGLFEEELGRRASVGTLPAACIVVDLYGQCADYSRIRAACEQYEVPLIEDAAEALGATYRGRPAGSFGAMGVFSFNGNKILTTSGGGMLISDRADWIEQARFLASQARDPAPHYEHSVIGYNYRLSNLLAALGRAQLRTLPEKIARRRAHREYYEQVLGGLPGVTLMPIADYGTPNYWLTCVRIDPKAFGLDRDQVRLLLERHDIESRPVWKPLHLQKAFAGCQAVGGAVSERLFEQGLCLPSGSAMADADRERVVALILDAAGEANA